MEIKKKILIVEDEVLSGMYLESKLKKYDYIILKPVTNGEDAVRTALDERPDFILMDVRLAGSMDGIEAAKKITQIYEPKFIFMTGFKSSEIKGMIEGMKNFAILEKPLRINEVIQYISAA